MKKLIKFLMIPSSLLYKEAHSNSGGFIPPFFFDFSPEQNSSNRINKRYEGNYF